MMAPADGSETDGRDRVGDVDVGQVAEPGQEIGTLAPGYEADIIATDGDPAADITAITRIAFVMKGGTVYKLSAGTARGGRSTP